MSSMADHDVAADNAADNARLEAALLDLRHQPKVKSVDAEETRKPKNLKNRFLDMVQVTDLVDRLEKLDSKAEWLEAAHGAVLKMMSTASCKCKLVLGPGFAEPLLDLPLMSLEGPLPFTFMEVATYPEIGLLWGMFVLQAKNGAAKNTEMISSRKLKIDRTSLSDIQSYCERRLPEDTKHIYSIQWTLHIKPSDKHICTEKEQKLLCTHPFYLDIICVNDTIWHMVICPLHER